MKLRKTALAALLAGFALPAAAQTYSFEFGSLLTGGIGVPAGGGATFAEMEISPTAAPDGNTYTFTLEILSPTFTTTFGSNAFVGTAGFNNAGAITTEEITLVSGGVSTISATNGGGGGGVNWDFGADYGNGDSDRLEAGESVTWTQSFSSVLNLVDPFAYLHVQGIAPNGESGKYIPNGSTPPIPEPETYAMMLAGLGLLGFVARRRRQSFGNVVPA